MIIHMRSMTAYICPVSVVRQLLSGFPDSVLNVTRACYEHALVKWCVKSNSERLLIENFTKKRLVQEYLLLRFIFSTKGFYKDLQSFFTHY